MLIPAYPFDSRLVVSHRLFPNEIENDDWILFHGTSSFNAPEIERGGFQALLGALPVLPIKRVEAIYHAMGWGGLDFGGYCVLASYSLGCDYASSSQSPIFLAETSCRALLYASRDFAGGEKRRALRRAITDLEGYLVDPVLWERHQQILLTDVGPASHRSYPLLPDPIAGQSPVDIGWLKQELASLSGVRQEASDSLARYDGGLIYALKLLPEDVPSLRQSINGIETHSPIPPSRIVGKIVVPKDYDRPDEVCGYPWAQVEARRGRGLFVALDTSTSINDRKAAIDRPV